MTLSMTPGLAKAVIHASEGKYGGHTLEKHVNISNADLYRRFESDSTRGNLRLFTAFDSISQCTEILSDLINSLSQREDFFRVFYKQAEGTSFNRERLELNRNCMVRMAQGRIETRYFNLLSTKRSDIKPIGFHIISFFPSMPNIALKKKDMEIAKKDPNYPYI